MRYDPSHYLIAPVELPRVSQVLEATPERPYLSFRLVLSPAVVSSVIIEAGDVSPPRGADVRATAVSPLEVDLEGATIRLVRLLDDPATAPILPPVTTRVIVHWLLMGQQGARLRYLVVRDGYNPLIARAVERLRRDFEQPLQVKTVTEMSPMQFRNRVGGRRPAA